MSGEAMALPPEWRWPECLHCGQPVTSIQQDIGAFRYFDGAGFAHRKCVKAAVTMIEAQMVAP